MAGGITSTLSGDNLEFSTGDNPVKVQYTNGTTLTFSNGIIGDTIFLRNVRDPDFGTDAATKNYVDAQTSALAAGIQWEEPVMYMETTIGDISASPFFDSVSIDLIPENTRVAVKNTTINAQNGVFVRNGVTGGATFGTGFARALKWDVNDTVESTSGKAFVVTSGTYEDTAWVQATDTGGVSPNIGSSTTPLQFVQISSQAIVQGANITVAGRTVNLNTAVTALNSIEMVEAAASYIDLKTGIIQNGRAIFSEPTAGDVAVKINCNSHDFDQIALQIGRGGLTMGSGRLTVAVPKDTPGDPHSSTNPRETCILADGKVNVTGLIVTTADYGTSSMTSLGSTALALDSDGSGNTLVVTNGDIHVANGVVTCTSDARLKDDIVDITSAGDLVKKIDPKYFTYKADLRKRKRSGVIAQEVREVVPEAVTEGSDGYLAVDYQYFTGLLLAHNKELSAGLDDLRAEIAELKRQRV